MPAGNCMETGDLCMTTPIDTLETQLNAPSRETRLASVRELRARTDHGKVTLPAPGEQVNLHCHTTYSYNGYGYTPAYLAWKARKAGLRVAGIVDFDVLDAVDEFLEAAGLLNLRACAGIESRVYVPEFHDREINSPGEPGIAYHMGSGFVSGAVEDSDFLAELKAIARERNRGVCTRVNAFLDPVTLDYDRDVAPLTPNGNATERHLCIAYDQKARALFPDPQARAAFWAERLGAAPADVEAILDDGPALQALVRSKTMKAGGVGYVKPAGPEFPALERFNAFVLAAGAIPTFCWLDGASAGEQAIEELLGLMLERGAAAVNIIPDRNWNIANPDVKRAKLDNLYRFVTYARGLDLPFLVGTEMNAYGQRFVDDFGAPELAPLTPVFVEGAHILYAHTLLQTHAGMGYLSPWARTQFATVREKNAFFLQLGETVEPLRAPALKAAHAGMTPEAVLALGGQA